MDIAALSVAMHMTDLQNQVGIAMLDKSLDLMDGLGSGMVKILEASVTPNLGQNIDIRV